ncbi:hypothetical protein [Paenibacillus sp. 23TSA30-6]|uniref:hypothetical protein n=1 Tax=Paenibacillus sp. 23TSA30-6 TaxID=2546104 RepID=UPI00178849A6|nr:hypothetical protein [Paenibacillus sp. 23TSA30-6]
MHILVPLKKYRAIGPNETQISVLADIRRKLIRTSIWDNAQSDPTPHPIGDPLCKKKEMTGSKLHQFCALLLILLLIHLSHIPELFQKDLK